MNDILHTPLDASEVIDKVPGCRFIAYENMHLVKSVRELLPRTLILYQLAKVGHFCCVFNNQEGINFFDPMGMFPDDELTIINPTKAHQTHQDFTYLVKLLSDGSGGCIWNEYKYQTSGTSTCGMWCAIRMIYSDLTNQEFHHVFRNIPNKDMVIANLYFKI